MIERASKQLELDKYILKNKAVKQCNNSDCKLFKVFEKNVKEDMHQLTTFDMVVLKNIDFPDLIANIHELLKDHIVFKLKTNKDRKQFKSELRYNMIFV